MSEIERLPPGVVNVVVVTAEGGAFLEFDRRLVGDPERRVGIGPVARQAWDRARAHLPSVLPATVRAIPAPLRADERPFTRLKCALAPDGRADQIHTVDGASLGAALLLAEVSEVLGVGIPSEIVVSATLEADGTLGPVEGLEWKVEAAMSAATCGLRNLVRFFVASEGQAKVVEQCLGERRSLTPIPVRSASALITTVFGEALTARLDADAQDPGRRAEIVQELLDTALAGRSAFMDWGPLAAGADRVLAHSVAPAERFLLGLVAAIARRHEEIPCVFPDVPPGVLDSLTYEDVLRLAQNVEQHAADFGGVAAATRETLVMPLLPPLPLTEQSLRLAPAPVLRLLGARGRYLASVGCVREALEIARGLVPAWDARRQPADITFPLSEVLRLSGLLGERSLFDEAAARWHRLRGDPRLPVQATPITDAFRIRGAALLGDRDADVLALSDQWLVEHYGDRAFPRCFVLRIARAAAARLGDSERERAHRDALEYAATAERERYGDSAGLHQHVYARQCAAIARWESDSRAAPPHDLLSTPAWTQRYERLRPVHRLFPDLSEPEAILRAWPY